jgi:hypothetical protein
MSTGVQASDTRRLHWYRGEQDKGQTPCGKGTNRVAWTDRDEVWFSTANAKRLCGDCRAARSYDLSLPASLP